MDRFSVNTELCLGYRSVWGGHLLFSALIIAAWGAWMSSFLLCVCCMEMAAGIHGGWGSRIGKRGWTATANGEVAESDRMTVELGGFWRKLTEVGGQFMEVPRRLRHESNVEWVRRRERIVLEEKIRLLEGALGG